LLTLPRIGIDSGSDSGLSSYEKVSAGITMALGLCITAIIIASIVKFSKFRLITLEYQRDTILTVLLGVASVAFVFSSLDIFGGIFIALQVFFSIWLMAYAILVRRRVLKGKAKEMKRVVKGGAEGHVDVELDGGMRGSTPAEPPPAYRPPPQGILSQKTVVDSVSETRRPSQSSLTGGGKLNAPLKEVREFV
jgi:hypothetical protein